MSSGACRSLVALLLTIVATIGLAVPVAAEEPNLKETSSVVYTVDPSTGRVDVTITITLQAQNRAVKQGEWGPIVVEDRVKVEVTPNLGKPRFEDGPGLWQEMYVTHPRVEEGGQAKSLRVKYSLDASDGQGARLLARVPARVNRGYIYVCVPGQDTDRGSTTLEIDSNRPFDVDQSGSLLNASNNKKYESGVTQNPKDLFTCIEGTRDGQLERSNVPGPDDRLINLSAWPGDDDTWRFAAGRFVEPVLDEIRAFLEHEIPGEGPIEVRQAPPRSTFGYASDHDTRGIVQLDEKGGFADPNATLTPEHELAHAWFGTDNFIELWLREGLAEWTATSIAGETCAAVDGNDTGVELGDWKVVKPFTVSDTIEQDIAAQQAAACGIVSAMADRMSPEQWNEVLGSMLSGEAKYVGRGDTDTASASAVDYREWLDAVDERGLVPAGATPAYAANLENLDYAQELVYDFGAEVERLELDARSVARAEYHQFLRDAAPLGAPLAVRKAMDSWEFSKARAALQKSYEVLEALNEANELLPTAGLIPFVQPAFESAGSEAALDGVLTETLTLLDSASEVFEPINELQNASPEGWNLPAAINQAITDQRFDAITSAIPPALTVVRQLTAADQALPQAGLLDTYRVRYESTSTIEQLDELAGEVASVRREAQRASTALNELQDSAGDWQIPAAVTDPLESGQITAGLAIVSDARAVVNAAREARDALPSADIDSEIKPQFEAVVTSDEMATLRADAEAQRDQAVSIGSALATLRSLSDWEIPAVITTPIENREFETAAAVATVAQSWIEDADEANSKLPAMDAVERARLDFESAETLEDLQAGAEKARNWNLAAARVAEAEATYLQERGMLARIGLLGVDVKPILDEAIDAAIAGDVETAFNRAVQVIDTLNSAASSGGLRLAGVVFLGVAVLGVLGLWLMLRREAGPPWARQTKPHWVEDKGSRWGKSKDKDNKNKNKNKQLGSGRGK